MKKLVAAVVCLFAALAIACTQYVHHGYVGVTDAGGTIKMMDHGLHLRAPWNHVTFYPVQHRGVDVKSSMAGAHGRTDFDLTLYMLVHQDSVPRLHADYRGRHIEALVVPLVAGYLEGRGGAASYFYGPEATAMGKEIVALLDSSLARVGIDVVGAELRSYEVVRNPGNDQSDNPR
jgi:hypothetical protein